MTRIQAQRQDPEELRFGLGLFTRIVETNAGNAADSPIHKSFFALLQKFDENAFTRHFDCHIACFSPHGEDFDLWENFGDRGAGVALEIDASFFSIRPQEKGEPKWVVQPVTYGQDEPLHSMRKVIQVATIALGEIAPLVKTHDDAIFVMENFLAQVALAHSVPMCMLAKTGHFVPEAEIRMLSTSQHPPGAKPEHHKSAIFDPKKYLKRVLIGERADRGRVEEILRAADLEVRLATSAAYSWGLNQH